MSKSTFFTGQPILSQILSLIPRSMVEQNSRDYEADRYCKRFKAYDHVVTMLFSVYSGCNSLREVSEFGIEINGNPPANCILSA